MAEDLFHLNSRLELQQKIGRIVRQDKRTLPPKAKVFAAVAELQKFDHHPRLASPEELSTLIAGGAIELQRGLSSSSGMAASFFAADLLTGPLFPGLRTAFGQGIYLATSSRAETSPETFPMISQVALKYARKTPPGIVVRCILKHDAKICEAAELKQYMVENRNRARQIFGDIDLGTFAAALGFDGYSCGNVEHEQEVTWVVQNRAALVFQTQVLQIGSLATD